MSLRTLTFAAIILVNTTSVRADDHASHDDNVAWGFAAKVRRSWATPYVQKLFMGDTPGTATLDGAGFDFSRRSGDSEVVFGFGYDRLDAEQGYYLEKGGNPMAQGDVDFVTFQRPRWYTLELAFVNHVRLHKFLELRFGGGAGLGLVRGSVRKTDAVCTSAELQRDCMIDPMAVEVNKPADIPPVLPVVTVLVGLQLRPFNFLHVHIDAGLHTVPYVTAGVSLYLW